MMKKKKQITLPPSKRLRRAIFRTLGILVMLIGFFLTEYYDIEVPLLGKTQIDIAIFMGHLQTSVFDMI